jgi:A/G-specific adenine glycosylase
MQLNNNAVTAFQNFIWDFYAREGRQFPWRHAQDPYRIMVSEIMLQQTQTYRVEPKYEQFLAAFPNCESLAQATLRDVLSAWTGLGYNRRGMALYNSAKKVMEEFDGNLPNDPEVLVTFPGIGKATAASICAFAFNRPTVFIETNIRTVFIHTFFQGQTDVHDKQLLPLIEQTLAMENPREWYYALMDYGVHLKKSVTNPSRKSKHHTKQSRFEGSDRQIRGAIIRELTRRAGMTHQEIVRATEKEPERVERILTELCDEKLVQLVGNVFSI